MASHADDPQRQAHAILGKIWYLMPQGRTDSAIKELQEATRLLAGRGSRADEIVIYGVLALAYLRRQDGEQAQHAAHRAASLIAQSRPTAAYTLEGYAGVTEVYLNLWMAGDHATARPAEQARAALRRLARTFPTAQPRAWLYEGLSAHHLGRKRHAVAAWTKSLKTAERLAMPYEQGRAHYEFGRHFPPDHPDSPGRFRPNAGTTPPAWMVAAPPGAALAAVPVTTARSAFGWQRVRGLRSGRLVRRSWPTPRPRRI